MRRPLDPALLLLATPLLLGTSAQHNVVFILTDDQDITLGSLDVMPKVKALLTDQGAFFHNGFATTPICCPSRAEIITGRHMHNTGVSGNDCGGMAFRDGPEKLNVATYAKAAGYDTFYAGKYLNNYGSSATGGVGFVPPGWDTGNWNGLVGNSKYYSYTLSVNGKAEHHGQDYTTDYLTDLIANRSTDFIAKHAVGTTAAPFFVMLGTPASHIPDDYAPWTSDMFVDGNATRTPNWNHAPNPDKHWMMRYIQPMDGGRFDGGEHNASDWVAVKRWRTLQSVDVMVERIVQTLTDAGTLNNTYIIYSSDHGYHLGQFGLGYDKRQLYEEDIRVPLIVRGPGIAAGQTITAPAAHIDLAPTIMDMLHLPAAPQMDGRSWLPLVAPEISQYSKEGVQWRSEMLIEYNGPSVSGTAAKSVPKSPFSQLEVDVDPHTGEIFDMGTPPLEAGAVPCKWFNPNSTTPSGEHVPCDPPNNTYACIRSMNSSIDVDSIYCEFNDDENFVEYYDLTVDPWQLQNVAPTAHKDKLARLAARLRAHMACSGAGCFNPKPAPAPHHHGTTQFVTADGRSCLTIVLDGAAEQPKKASLSVEDCSKAVDRATWQPGKDPRGNNEIASTASHLHNDTLCFNVLDATCAVGAIVHAGPCQATEAKLRVANHFHFDSSTSTIVSEFCKSEHLCVGSSGSNIFLVDCSNSSGVASWTERPVNNTFPSKKASRE